MVKINLLGEKLKTSNKGLLIVGGYIVSMIVFFITAFGMYTTQSSRMAELDQAVQEADSKLSKLKEKTKEVRDLEQKKAELDNLTLAIASLKKSQEGPLQLLQDINTSVPERAWIDQLAQKGDIVKISGYSINDASLVALMKNLETVQSFERIDLLESLSVPLTQISVFNTSNSETLRYIVGGDSGVAGGRISIICGEYQKMGLTCTQGQPQFGGGNTNVITGSSFGMRTNSAGRNTVYVWSNMESIQAKKYIIEAKIKPLPKYTVQQVTANKT